MFLTIIALGLVNWFGTYLLVESEFFRPYREWIDRREERAWHRLSFWFWSRFKYFKDCHTCTGTWVGLALVPFAPAVFGPGFLSYVVLGLLIKAIGHLFLVLHKYLEALTDDVKRRHIYLRERKSGNEVRSGDSRAG